MKRFIPALMIAVLLASCCGSKNGYAHDDWRFEQRQEAYHERVLRDRCYNHGICDDYGSARRRDPPHRDHDARQTNPAIPFLFGLGFGVILSDMGDRK